MTTRVVLPAAIVPALVLALVLALGACRQAPPPDPGEHSRSALLDWGFADEAIERLVSVGALQTAAKSRDPDGNDRAGT